MNAQHSTEAYGAATDPAPNAIAHFQALPDEALIGAATMAALFDVRGNATLYKWEKAGRIPASRRIAGSSHRRWVVGEVRAALRTIATGVAGEVDHAQA